MLTCFFMGEGGGVLKKQSTVKTVHTIIYLFIIVIIIYLCQTKRVNVHASHFFFFLTTYMAHVRFSIHVLKLTEQLTMPEAIG